MNMLATIVWFFLLIHLWRSLDWNNPDGIKCAKETSPILNTTMPLNVGTDRRLFTIASNVTKSMKLGVNFINITKLSEYRKDAHTSVYTIRQGKMLTPEQQADPTTYADCIHWCLPGLPDTWNEFIYARIISSSSWSKIKYSSILRYSPKVLQEMFFFFFLFWNIDDLFALHTNATYHGPSIFFLAYIHFIWPMFLTFNCKISWTRN